MIVNDSRPFEGSPDSSLPTEVEEVKTLIYSDDLTCLYNRRFFRHCIAEQKNEADNTRSSFALVTLDIDHFKEINDFYGHSVGDSALSEIANILKEEFGAYGWIFRYAGDEFVAILRGQDEEQARAICSRILSRLSRMQETPSQAFAKISISAGIAIYPSDSNSISGLLGLSDRALYASKRAGRGLIHSARQISLLNKTQSEQWPVAITCNALIGREQQWRMLQNQISECKNGYGGLVLISGEAGIGKSRLLREFSQRQRAGDFHILIGECTEGTVIHSYGPVRDALKKGFEAKDPATINVYRELDLHYRRELIALVPQFDRYEKGTIAAGGGSDSYLLLESLLLLLRGLAAQLPIILILEDIHWSDAATVHLLHYLARAIRHERILVLATFRSEEALDSPLPALFQNLTRENLYRTIEVGPLSAEHTGMMLEEIFRGYSMSPSFKDSIYRESEGIPFYVEELLKLLMEEGHLQRFGQELSLTKPDKSLLPASIKALIQRRIGRLNETEQRVLGYASIIGYEFDVDILMKLIEENEGYLLDVLEALVRGQLIHEVSGEGEELFEFHHNKIRDAIYEEMGLIKRRKFHHRVGEILERMHRENVELYAEDLAYHFDRAGDVLKAFNYSLVAGKKCLQIHAYQDALKHFDHCLQYNQAHGNLLHATPLEIVADLAVNRGFALEALGLWDKALDSYQSLLELGDVAGAENYKVDGLNYLSRVHYRRESFNESLNLAAQALNIAERLNYRRGMANGFYNTAKSHWRNSKFQEAFTAISSAIETAEQADDLALKAKFLNTAAIILMERGQITKASEFLEEALGIFHQQGDKAGIVDCLANISIARQLWGNFMEARQHIVTAFGVAQEIGDPERIASCSVNQAELEFKLGNYELGTRLNERAGRIYNELDHPLGLTYYLENESHSVMVHAQLDAALETIGKARAIAEEKKLKRRILELSRQQATIHYYRGEYVSAIGCLEKVRASAVEMHDDLEQAHSELKLGFIYYNLGDRSRAIESWQSGLNADSNLSGTDLLFWKNTASGFLAALQNSPEEALLFQNEMQNISEAANYAYLMTAASLLTAHQFEIVQSLTEALRAAEEALKRAIGFQQELWQTRARWKIIDLQRKLMQPLAEDPKGILEAAQKQGQNDIVYRCLKFLRMKKAQLDHWQTWKEQIPQAYHSEFLL